MTEVQLSSGPAAVYYYQDSTWKPVDGGISTVAAYHNPATNLYRVVALSPSAGPVINSAIFKELTLVKLSDNFYNWADQQQTYGVNFANVDDANNFAQSIVSAIAALSGAGTPDSSLSKTKPADSSGKSAVKPAAKAAPVPSAKPAAPTATPGAAAQPTGGFKKAAPSPSAGATLGAKKGDSLVRDNTWKATPTGSPSTAGPSTASAPKPASSSAAPKSSTLPKSQLTPEYEAMKQEMLIMFREELDRAKADILDSLRR